MSADRVSCRTLEKLEVLLEMPLPEEAPGAKQLQMYVTPSNSTNPYLRQINTLFTHFAVTLSAISFVFLLPRLVLWIIQACMTKSNPTNFTFSFGILIDKILILYLTI